MTAMLLVLGLLIPHDTLLVSVELVETRSQVTVEAVMEADSTILLPSAAVRDLLGVQLTGPWVALADLRRAFPTVVFQWQPEMGRVLVFDELIVLPAVKRFRETHRATAFGVTPLPAYSGTYGGVAIDDQRRALLDAGYTWRGRFQVAGRVDDAGVGQWNAALAPLPFLFLSGTGGTHQQSAASGRIQVGRFWLLATYAEHQALDAAALARVGPASVFISRSFAAVTLQHDPAWSFQAARTRSGRSVIRFSWGPIPSSPFSLPLTSLH